LVEQMSSEWKPEQYKDEYSTALMKLIDEKVKAGGKEIPGHKKQAHAAATNVVDLVEVLQKSLKSAGKPAAKSKSRKRAMHHKHAA
jgi:DNA end-binding protein Ku